MQTFVTWQTKQTKYTLFRVFKASNFTYEKSIVDAGYRARRELVGHFGMLLCEHLLLRPSNPAPRRTSIASNSIYYRPASCDDGC